jgi:hypothetical protein
LELIRTGEIGGKIDDEKIKHKIIFNKNKQISSSILLFLINWPENWPD